MEQKERDHNSLPKRKAVLFVLAISLFLGRKERQRANLLELKEVEHSRKGGLCEVGGGIGWTLAVQHVMKWRVFSDWLAFRSLGSGGKSHCCLTDLKK